MIRGIFVDKVEGRFDVVYIIIVFTSCYFLGKLDDFPQMTPPFKVFNRLLTISNSLPFE